MELLDLSFFGEVSAALAAVVTLVYLAIQIRLSNKLAVSAIEHQLNTCLLYTSPSPRDRG